MMDFSITTEQQDIKEEIIAFARAHMNENIQERDKHQIFDRTLWNKLGALKIQGLCIPETYGGKGYDPLTTVLALEALGEGCEDGGMSFAIAAHLLACCVPIWKYGTEEQKKTYLPKLSNGTWIAANAMTEEQSGSDAYNLTTTAVKSGNNYILKGRKSFVSNGPVADVLVTYASTNKDKGFFGGISAFLLQKDKDIFHASSAVDKTGIRTCLSATVDFENLEVSKNSLIGQEGGGGPIFHRSMEWERICLGAIHLGAMKRMLDKTVEFVRTRESSGKPIGEHQSISHQLANLRVKLEAARLMTYQGAYQLNTTTHIGINASMVKLMVSETYKEFSSSIFQIYAGAAYQNNHEAERMLRDALGSTIYSGTSEVQRNIIAKHMGI